MALGVGLNKDNGTVSFQTHYHPHSLPGLPRDIQSLILFLLLSKGSVALSSVSRCFAVLTSDNSLWKRLFEARFPHLDPQFSESFKALYKEENRAEAVRTGQLHSIILENQGNVICAKICGEFICTGLTDGTIIVLDQITGKTLCTIPGEIGRVLSIDMPMNSSILCTGGERGVQAWNVDTQKGISHPLFSHIDQQDNPMGLIKGWIKIYEDRWLCAAGFDRHLSIWDLETKKKVLDTQKPIHPQRGALHCVHFSEDGIICTKQGRIIVIIDLKTGRFGSVVCENAGVDMKICNNKLFYAASKTIFVWDVRTRESLPPIKAPPFPANFSPNIVCMDIKQDTLCVGWGNNWLSVHSVETGELRYVFLKGENILKDVLNGTAVSDCDVRFCCGRVKMIHNTILASQRSVSICFWNLETGQKLHEEYTLDTIRLFDIQDNTFLTCLFSKKMMISRFK
jgi:WD40 repeat protein